MRTSSALTRWLVPKTNLVPPKKPQTNENHLRIEIVRINRNTQKKSNENE